MELIKNILILVDESDSSEIVVEYAYHFVNQLNAKVGLLHVNHFTEFRMDTPIVINENMLDKFHKEAQDFLDNMREKYGKNTDTSILVKEGNIKSTVLSTAKAWNADLLVAGTHTHKGLNKIFSNSISENILHDSSIPMLIIPVDKVNL